MNKNMRCNFFFMFGNIENIFSFSLVGEQNRLHDRMSDMQYSE